MKPQVLPPQESVTQLVILSKQLLKIPMSVSRRNKSSLKKVGIAEKKNRNRKSPAIIFPPAMFGPNNQLGLPCSCLRQAQLQEGKIPSQDWAMEKILTLLRPINLMRLSLRQTGQELQVLLVIPMKMTLELDPQRNLDHLIKDILDCHLSNL